MKKMKKIFIILCLVLIPVIAYCEDLYVRPVNDCTGAPCGSANGSDWANAYNGFADITWGSGAGEVSAGDTLYISGGSSSAVYNEKLTIGASGAAGSLIYIKPGSESASPEGHDGTATITLTTGCTDGGTYATGCHGITTTTTRSYWTIDGGTSKKIKVSGCLDAGIHLIGSGHHITIKNVEIANNGNEVGSDSTTQSGLYFNMSTPTTANYPQTVVDTCLIYGNAKYQQYLAGGGGVGNAAFDRHITQNTEFTDPHGEDVYNCSNNYGCTFDGNTVHGAFHFDKLYGHPDGITMQTSYAKVINNVIYDLRTAGTVVGTTGSITSLSGTALIDSAATFTNSTVWNDAKVRFTSGALSGNYYNVSARVNGTQLTLASNIQTAGAQVGDTYIFQKTMGAYIYINSLNPATVTQVLVYNNLIYNTTTDFRNYEWPQCITVSLQGTATSMTDSIFANNTCVNMSGPGYEFPFTNGETFSGVQIVNNVCHNCGYNTYATQVAFWMGDTASTTGSVGSGANIIVDYNVASAGANGTSNSLFGSTVKTWAAFNASCTTACNANGSTTAPTWTAAYVPTVEDTALKDTGTSMSTYFTTDQAGSIRDATFDIGAYEYTVGAAPHTDTPDLVSFTVNVSGTTATMVLDENVTVVDGSGFTLDCDETTGEGLEYVSELNGTLQFNITGRMIQTGETCTFGYTTVAGGIFDEANLDLESIVGGAVTNSSGYTPTVVNYTVSITLAEGGCSISPYQNVVVNTGKTTVFTATCNNGWRPAWSGTCGGTASGTNNVTYTTSAVTADCGVTLTPTEILLMPW